MKSIYKLTFGTPEEITPVRFKRESKVTLSDSTAYDVSRISFEITGKGCKIELLA